MLEGRETNYDWTKVVVWQIPKCQFCSEQAKYDGATKAGPWAYMCSSCFERFGVGIGLGRGQELVLSKDLGETK